jgi:hypothetical protein
MTRAFTIQQYDTGSSVTALQPKSPEQ